jgi:NAD(P)H-dependent FMN reductase
MNHIVCVSGSSRVNSYTSFALRVVARALEDAGVSVSFTDVSSLTLNFPGQPETEDAQALRASVKSASAVVLATPEYHGTFSAALKLVIENLGFPSALSGKPVGLLGVASGRIGAIKSLEQLRGVCSHTGAIVLPRATSIAGVRAAFSSTGEVTDNAVREALEELARSLSAFMRDHVCPKYVLEDAVRSGSVAPWPTQV